VVSDSTPVGPCGETNLVAQKGQIKLRAVAETCPAKSTLWTNCVQKFDPNVYWCLNGQVREGLGFLSRRVISSTSQ
jgi:hypothetical protein